MRTDADRVCVIVATYNRARYIEQAVDSLLTQTRPLDEIWIVDDGSTDGTAARIANYGSRVRYLKKENGGKSTALNLGLANTSCEWVWFFDDDDVALPNALERMLLALSRSPRTVFAYSSQIIGRDRGGLEMVEERTVGLPDTSERSLFQHALCAFPFLMQGMLVRTDCVREVGAFDPRYARGQDYEFCLRLIRRYEGTAVDGPTFIWRVHDGPRGPKNEQHAGAERAAVWMKFSSLMGRELRASLPLGDYLDPRVDPEALTPALRQRALVQRMSVMASKGLIDEMLEDMRLYVAAVVSSGVQAMTHAEVAASWRIPTYDYYLQLYLREPRKLAGSLLNAAGRAGLPVVRSFARGLLWVAVHADLPVLRRVQIAGHALWLLLLSALLPNRACRES